MISWFQKRLNIAFQYKDLLYILVVRDLKLKYRRSFLGYLWSILNPLLVMIVMTIVFSSMFNAEIVNFPVYLFTGQLIFNYTISTTNMALDSIIGNGILIKKVYVPKYIFVLSRTASCMVDTIFSLAALVLIMIATGARFTAFNLLFPFVLVQLMVFTFGLSLFLAASCVFFRDIRYIYNAITTVWIYVTPIFYPIERLPQEIQWLIKHMNPLYPYVAQFRDLVYYNRIPGNGIILAGILYALGMFVIGLYVFFKKQDEFILYI